MQISVTCGEDTVIYQLNHSAAAVSLWEQLPLTIEVEDYSTNEKIFYPPQALDIIDTPMADEGAGTLAYYEPWGDVVLFTETTVKTRRCMNWVTLSPAESLVSRMTGTITIDAVDSTVTKNPAEINRKDLCGIFRMLPVLPA